MSFCHKLFIPSVQTFALTDTIPFHLQLCSSMSSLRDLLPPYSPHLQITCPTTSSKIIADPYAAECTIRVSIARQVVVEVNGRRRFRTFTIGIGKMWSIPPQVAVMDYEHGEGDPFSGDADADICLDWQGEVKCWGEVTSGGFSVGNLIVKVCPAFYVLIPSCYPYDLLMHCIYFGSPPLARYPSLTSRMVSASSSSYSPAVHVYPSCQPYRISLCSRWCLPFHDHHP